MNQEGLKNLACRSIIELTPEDIILASSQKEAYGCLFGRDAALTDLKLLKIVERGSKLPCLNSDQILKISEKTLLRLVGLRGREYNIESNEKPGQFIHEYRTEGFDRLVNLPKDQKKPWLNPWYIYPDQTLRSYDSIDSTPLILIALYKHWIVSKDEKFLKKALPSIYFGLSWIFDYGDIDKDHLIEYEFANNRRFGGLVVQSWTDSQSSLQKIDGTLPKYPIAPVEPQGFAWLALKLWAQYYLKDTPDFAYKLLSRAQKMKTRFNEVFLFKEKGLYFPAQALDGDKQQIKTVTGNPLFLLWASYQKSDGKFESIIDDIYIPDLVKRSFKSDMFDSIAGIRTMSIKSPTFNPGINSYHNGSFWPMLNGFAYEGLINWGYEKQAERLKKASIKPLLHFQTPLELYILGHNREYLEYVATNGQSGCRTQAWTTAVILDLLTS